MFKASVRISKARFHVQGRFVVQKHINKKLSKVPCSKHRLESAQDKRGFMF